MSQESRIALFALAVSGCARTAAYSGVIVRGCEYGDAAVSAGAKARGSFIARNVHLVLDRVGRNRMGACGRCRVGVLVTVIRVLVSDAEYRTAQGRRVVRPGEEVMVVAGIVPNFVVTVQTG